MDSSNGQPVRIKRARGSKNPYWRLFQVITGDHAQCTLCSVIIGTAGGNTSGINRHVQRFHVDAVQELEDATFEEGVGTPTQQLLSTPRPAKETPARLLARALASGGAPLSFVQNSHFKQFLKLVGSAAISEERVKNELWTMADNSRHHSKMLLKDRENLVLVYDKWTIPNSSISIITVFLIHVDDNFKRTITFVGCRHLVDGDSMASVLHEVQDCVHSVGLRMNQIARVVSDEKPEFEQLFTNLKHTPCLGLILSRIIETIMSSDHLKDILEKAQRVVDSLSQDSNFKLFFQDTAQKMGVETKGLRVYSQFKWGYQYLLVKAYLEASKAIKATEQLRYLKPTEEEKKVGAECIDMLDEIFSVLSQFEQDESTASSIIPNIVAMSRHLKQHQYQETPHGNFIRSQFENQTSALINNEELQLLCFADPRFAFFQGAMGTSSWESVENRFLERYENSVTQNAAGNLNSGTETPAKRVRKSALESFMDQKTEAAVGGANLKSEMAKYRYHIQLIGRPAALEDPLDFWCKNQAKFVILSNICKHLLAVPGSGTASGKAFLSSGHMACNLQHTETSKKTINCMLLVNARSKLAKMNSKVFIEEEPTEQSNRPPIPSRSTTPQPPQPDELPVNVKQEQFGMLLAALKQEPDSD